MTKIEKEYIEKYGDIPISETERVGYLLSTLSLSHKKTSVMEEIKRIHNIEWKKLDFTIYMIPKGTPRPRLGSKGVFYVKGAKIHKNMFSKFIKKQDIPLITTATKFTCKSYFPIPQSMNNIEKIVAELGFIRPIGKPDWDNVGKTYCDMLIDNLLYDDSLIIEGTSKKYYSIKPRIEISLEYALSHDSKFNEKKEK